MNTRHILLLLTLFIALRAEGATVRVTAVENGRTLVVERHGKSERVTLAGVAVTDDASARTMLEWTLVSRWVSLEQTSGGHFVYRSPDALFINRELVLRGFARATLSGIEPVSHVPVTYLGTLDLPAPTPAVRNASGSRTGSAPSSRRSTSRSRRPGRRR
ncbi:MAG TPA: hypothetical protein VE974_09820 [Thermoanaerobaculia bacterium]|nr:hypothetical protein [Thermoanaerobaculia bacterium]